MITAKGKKLQGYNEELMNSLDGMQDSRDECLYMINKEEERRNELLNYISNIKEEVSGLDSIFMI